MMKYLQIALLSISLLFLELVWTRIFSAEFFYTFAFLILSLAMMGLGLGALSLRLFPLLNRIQNLGMLLTFTGLMMLAGPVLVFRLNLDFSKLFISEVMILKFLLTILLLSASFFLGGICLAWLFKKYHQDMPRLYMSDLFGAGVGVLLAMVLMNHAGTPAATFLSAIPILIAAVLAGKKWMKVFPLMLMGAMIFPILHAPSLMEAKREERAPVVYKHWDAMAKIKIYEYDEDYRGINIDNAANSPVTRFDGNWDRPDSLRFEFGIDVSYLIGQFESPTFLSLGSGAGQDVLQALQAGAAEIHAVEVIPHINDLMMHGELAEYTGHIYADPRVKVITEDARAYVRRHQQKFDIIYSLSSNTFAALTSGAFALAENYLFTTEAFQDYWNALTADGFMMMEHQFYMPRLVSELMQALEKSGVRDAKSHFAIYNLPRMRRNMLLLSKRPLTDEIRTQAFGELQPQDHNYAYLLYPAADSVKDNLINRIVENGWMNAADSAVINISPASDNLPFVAQMGLWKNFEFKKLQKLTPYEFSGFPLSRLIIVFILASVVLFIIPLNLLPYLRKGEKLKLGPWLYFFLIGMAFMIVEVILIQRYTLFIGPSIYSILTVLLSLLISSGIGSRFSVQINDRLAFLGIVVWLLLEIMVFRQLTGLLSGLTMLPRILVSALLIMPLGFFMGMPFPKGSARVGALIDWGFAVNGAASVFGSTLILLIAFSFGFNAALMVGALSYGLAYCCLLWKRAW